jgi:hypothetical protein
MRAIPFALSVAACAVLAPPAAAEPKADPVVAEGLRWLKAHQSKDGGWDAKSFDKQCKLNRCDSAGDAPHAAATTGLALLAFLGVGSTHQAGDHRDCVKSGLDALARAQDAKGSFVPADAPHARVGHALALLAMTEAFGMTRDAALRPIAQKGLESLLAEPGPWKDGFNLFDEEMDARAMPWEVSAIASARVAGLQADPKALERVFAWFDGFTHPSGYVLGPSTFKPDEFLTAAGYLARVFQGRTPKTDSMAHITALWLGKQVTEAPKATDADATLLHLTTLVYLHSSPDLWTRWRQAVKPAIGASQWKEAGRDERGSWTANGTPIPGGGRVQATAVRCLTLTACSR